MLDMLLGGSGETPESVAETIALLKQIDLLRPTLYIASTLGENPARQVCELIDGDPRFFEPEEEVRDERVDASGDHNYNQNDALSAAIADEARGAYWDILRGMRGG